MDVRLPAQLRRPLQVPGPVCFVSQIGQAAPVDPLGPARPLQRPVRRLLPRPSLHAGEEREYPTYSSRNSARPFFSDVTRCQADLL